MYRFTALLLTEARIRGAEPGWRGQVAGRRGVSVVTVTGRPPPRPHARNTAVTGPRKVVFTIVSVLTAS